MLIVNQAFVRKYFGKTQPLGRLVQVMPEPQYPARTYQVVGTVADTKYNDLRKSQSQWPLSQSISSGDGARPVDGDDDCHQ